MLRRYLSSKIVLVREKKTLAICWRASVDLQHLKWTKNVNAQDDEFWAYVQFKSGYLFKLSWKENEANASRPLKDDLILLRQKGYVTHLIKVLDYKPERETWQGDFNIYRIVETLWVIDFDHPPVSAKVDQVFDYPGVLSYEGGNVMELETLPTFKQRWDSDGGHIAFQERIRAVLDLP